MLVRRGMKMEDVLAVRDDLEKVYEEGYEGKVYEEYEGEAQYGGVLCVGVVDGVVDCVEVGDLAAC